jgi:hypothetical protein
MSEFLDCFKAHKASLSQNSGQALFSNKSQGQKLLPFVRLADPSYDQVFKKLFGSNIRIGGVDGIGRIISFLNSLFFPNARADDLQIRNAQFIPNECTRIDQTTAKGHVRLDIACRCYCEGNGHPSSEFIVDVEIQRSNKRGFSIRLFDYAIAMRLGHDRSSVKTIALLDYEISNQGECPSVGVFFRDDNLDAIGSVEGLIDINCVSLPRAARTMAETNDAIKFGGRELGVPGQEWLKLLSLRHWALEDNGRYIVPQASASDPGVKSALLVLANESEYELHCSVIAESEQEERTGKEGKDGLANTMKSVAKPISRGSIRGKRTRMVHTLLSKKVSVEEIADFMGLSTHEVEKLV